MSPKLTTCPWTPVSACHLSITLSVGSTGATPLIQSRIVGGWECEKHSQPWQVAVYSHGWAHCGGVLVHPQWVLTGAHCRNENSQVWLGWHNLFEPEDTGQSIPVSRSFPHPLYNTSLLKHQSLGPDENYSDHLMLLRLLEPAKITDTVKVLGLPTREPALGTTCYAAGWGSIQPKEFFHPKSLQCVSLHLFSNDMCARAYSETATEFMLCAGHWTGGKDTCKGDSGGPLVCNGVLQGITSWGPDPCALPEKPGVYTKVVHYRKWIKDTIMANL
ncbi:kallikrein-2-like [Cebus imitator]|uniref:kallikrein-2-like n=1 Tax=Cebus imitator TaxID=2715852 RepID=UPI00189C27D4|nr:kallikrein-2-like [Cebus imitator]